jgi:D-glycero-alpha-D-manno-heptose 1-phosphate guanylyltransferase
MHIKQAIILAGGFGTRLQSVVKDIPKPMAPIGNRPFLEFVLDHCYSFGLDRIVLAVGYKHEIIQKHFGQSYRGMQIQYSIEEEALGTGGGILQAAMYCNEEDFIVLNGDTLFRTNLRQLAQFYKEKKADLVLALCPMNQFDRYGTVRMKPNNRIIAFEEKSFQLSGNINAGVYVMNKNTLIRSGLEHRFSFEKDFMEAKVAQLQFYGRISKDYFIDIGIPEDYQKAADDLL